MDSSDGFEQALPAEMAIVEYQKALEILKSGEVLGIPTETVYGLAARIDSESALRKIFETKKRPFFDPLIVHLSKSMDPKDFTLAWPEIYRLLSKQFWPGPLTMITPKNDLISDLITAGLPDVGLRMPSHSLAAQLIEDLNIPVAAPSANMFGKTSPTQAQHVIDEFKGVVPVLEGGDSQVGLESTVVKFESDENTLYILRPGIISADDLLKICEPLGVKIKSGTAQSAPGQLKAHYQPEVPLVLEMTDETQLTPQREMNLNKLLDQKALRWRPLYLERDPSMAARTLYSQLRERSQNKSEGIWLPLSPLLKKDSRWEMIFDRLERAASLVL